MTAAANPTNLKRLGVIGMVHLHFSCAAKFARFLYQLAALEINVGVSTGVVFPALRLCWRIFWSPFAHVLCVARQTVSLEAARFCSARANVFRHGGMLQNVCVGSAVEHFGG